MELISVLEAKNKTYGKKSYIFNFINQKDKVTRYEICVTEYNICVLTKEEYLRNKNNLTVLISHEAKMLDQFIHYNRLENLLKDNIKERIEKIEYIYICIKKKNFRVCSKLLQFGDFPFWCYFLELDNIENVKVYNLNLSKLTNQTSLIQELEEEEMNPIYDNLKKKSKKYASAILKENYKNIKRYNVNGLMEFKKILGDPIPDAVYLYKTTKLTMDIEIIFNHTTEMKNYTAPISHQGIGYKDENNNIYFSSILINEDLITDYDEVDKNSINRENLFKIFYQVIKDKKITNQEFIFCKEKDIILFSLFLLNLNSDIILTYNGHLFDFPYIVERYRHYFKTEPYIITNKNKGLSALEFIRDTPMEDKKKSSFNDLNNTFYTYGKKSISTRGNYVDLYNEYKKRYKAKIKDGKLNSFASYILFQKCKVLSTDVDEKTAVIEICEEENIVTKKFFKTAMGSSGYLQDDNDNYFLVIKVPNGKEIMKEYNGEKFLFEIKLDRGAFELNENSKVVFHIIKDLINIVSIKPKDLSFNKTTEIAKYCFHDAHLCIIIFEAILLEATIRRNFSLFGMPTNCCLLHGNSSNINMSFLKILIDNHYWKYKDNNNMVKGNLKGAMVGNIENVLYKTNVSVLDFQGLYPAIDRFSNISPEKIITILDDIPNCIIFDVIKKLEKKYPIYLDENGNRKGYNIVTTDSFIFQDKKRLIVYSLDTKGIIPIMIEKFTNNRNKFKLLKKEAKNAFFEEYYEGLQSSTKEITNSIYGLFGSSYSKFFSLDCASSITVMGRELFKFLKNIFKIVKEENGIIDLDMDYINNNFIKISDDIYKIIEKDTYVDGRVLFNKTTNTLSFKSKVCNMILKDLQFPIDLSLKNSSKTKINKKLNFIYGDTDSVFICIENCTIEQSAEISEKFTNHLNEVMFFNPLILEYENSHIFIIIFASKKYYAIEYGKTSPKRKGLTKRDTCKWNKNLLDLVYKKVYDYAMENKDDVMNMDNMIFNFIEKKLYEILFLYKQYREESKEMELKLIREFSRTNLYTNNNNEEWYLKKLVEKHNSISMDQICLNERYEYIPICDYVVINNKIKLFPCMNDIQNHEKFFVLTENNELNRNKRIYFEFWFKKIYSEVKNFFVDPSILNRSEIYSTIHNSKL